VNFALLRPLAAALAISVSISSFCFAADAPGDKNHPPANAPHDNGAAAAPANAAAGTAPAQPLRHGARSTAKDGTMVVYDKVTGVFVVPTRQNTFWIDNRFWQYDNGVWTAAPAIAGPWNLVADRIVPDVAREKFAAPKTDVTAKLPDGSEAVYEPRLRVFKVAGKKGMFLFDGMFWRYDHGIWYGSSKTDGPFVPTSSRELPAVLRNAVPAPGKGERVTLPSGDVLLYDDKADFFTVDGKPETIYFDGTFYEKRDKTWFSSSSSKDGFTEVAAAGKIPANVRKKPHGAATEKLRAEKKAAAAQNADDKTSGDDAAPKPAREGEHESSGK
jgi:hypothetical protein